jgi:hypothetical protein
MPVYLVAGNHDERSALRAALPRHQYLNTGGEFLHYIGSLGPLRLIGRTNNEPPSTLTPTRTATVRLRDAAKIYRTGEIEVPALRGISLDIPYHRFSMAKHATTVPATTAPPGVVRSSVAREPTTLGIV